MIIRLLLIKDSGDVKKKGTVTPWLLSLDPHEGSQWKNGTYFKPLYVAGFYCQDSRYKFMQFA